MKQNSEPTDWLPVPTGYLEKVLSSKAAPYETSLLSEYARLFLLLAAAPLVFCFAYFALHHQTGILSLVAGLILLVTLVTSRGFQVLRIALLVLVTVNVFASAINPEKSFGLKSVTPPQATAFLLLICLGIACVFELIAWVKSSDRTVLLKTFAWAILFVPAMIYLIGIPIVESIWTTIEGDKKKLALRDPNWNVLNESAFRAAKLAVFAVFTYLGACLGSFLNVVASGIPRGEPIGLRDSKCPQCDTKIGRIDNLPIFSYINLGGQCRNCLGPISSRYLIVEVVVAFIFGSLFLYELITGCDNVPLMNVVHEGILWVILYPKWPAIGIYFFHTSFMCALLVLALIEWDGQTPRWKFPLVTGFAFFAFAAAYPPIQPIPLFEHIPGVAFPLSPWMEQLIKLAVGGFLGAAIGGGLGRIFWGKSLSVLTFAFFLVGVVLGWQALIQVTALFAILSGTTLCLPKARRLFQHRPTAVLLIAVVLHHPFWKTIADGWRFN